MPHSGPYGCRIADRRLEMLPIRKTDATNLNLWSGSRSRKLELLSQMPEIVRNAVKFTFIRKVCDKIVVVKPEVMVYFGLLLVVTLKVSNGAR